MYFDFEKKDVSTLQKHILFDVKRLLVMQKSLKKIPQDIVQKVSFFLIILNITLY